MVKSTVSTHVGAGPLLIPRRGKRCHSHGCDHNDAGTAHFFLQNHGWGGTCLMVPDCTTTFLVMGSHRKHKPAPTMGVDHKPLLTRNTVLAVAGAASSPCTLTLSTYKAARSSALSGSKRQAPQLSTRSAISGTAQHPTAAPRITPSDCIPWGTTDCK